MVQREDNVEKFFEYEMSLFPISIFKNGLMRKPDKPAIRKYLVDGKVPESERMGSYVLDGGALLHRVRWIKGVSYEETCDRYTKHLEQYGTCTIVFDGYGTPSIKDHEHQRRECLTKTSANIQLSDTNVVYKDQDAFFANTHNKQQFIQLLSDHLRHVGHNVINCTDDADTEIVASAIEHAAAQRPVTVIADDTDVLLLLVHHFEEEMQNICFSSEKASKTWSIRDIVQQIGAVVKHHILFLHAWLGCDTTSAIFDQGKTGLCKKIKTSSDLQQLAEKISNPCATESDVVDAGRKVFMLMYGGDASSSLTKLR